MPSSFFRKILVFVVFLSLCFGTSLGVFARAGGGHGGEMGDFSSSSSSFGGGSMSSSSNVRPPTCAEKYPNNPTQVEQCQKENTFYAQVIGIIIAILIPGIIFFDRKRIFTKNTQIPFKSIQSTQTQISENLAKKIDDLKSLDPLWNEQQFKELVNTGFFKIQNAWCEGNMQPARAYISEGVWHRFDLQLEPYRKKNQKNILGQLSLDSVELLDIDFDEQFSRIVTRITATCTDTVVDMDDERVVEKNFDGKLTTWQEKWIWMRSKSVLTPEKEKGVFAEKCPNCGANLQINTTGQCDYCHSDLTKGEFDWVLSEIIQV